MRRSRRDGFRAPRRRLDEDERILPLINVVFLLLVFFMVAGRLTAGDPFPIDPPESASEGSPPEGRLIAFGPNGELALDGASWARRSCCPCCGTNSPEERLRSG
jgi:biopolymer transport protein ExbD